MGIIKVPERSVIKFKAELSGIIDSGNLAEGDWNLKLSEKICNISKAKYSVNFCSNGAAIFSILSIYKRFYNKKYIFIQSNTMYGVKTMASTSGLSYLGAVNCRISTLMPSLRDVVNFVNELKFPNETIFLMSHIGGIVNPDIVEICDFCRAVGVVVIEDCAHSLGATLNDKHSGTFGDAGVYSLYSTKAIPAGEGGCAITSNKDLFEYMSRFNIYDRFKMTYDIGVNFRISEIQALFSFCVLEEYIEILNNKKTVANRYINACEKAGLNFIHPYAAGQSGNNYKFTLLARESALIEFAHISNRTSSVYSYALGDDPESIVERHICLPIWFSLESEIVDSTINQILNQVSI